MLHSFLLYRTAKLQILPFLFVEAGSKLNQLNQAYQVDVADRAEFFFLKSTNNVMKAYQILRVYLKPFGCNTFLKF